MRPHAERRPRAERPSSRCRPPIAPEQTLERRPSGACSAFLVSEVAFFSTLIVTYVTFLGKDTVGPTPAEALSLPLVIVHDGLPALQQRRRSTWPSGRCERGQPARRSACCGRRRSCSGVAFLVGTAYRVARADHRAPPDDQPQPVRHDLLHAGRLPRPARDRRRDRHADRARPGAAPPGDRRDIAPASSWSPGTGTSSTPSGSWCSRWSTWPSRSGGAYD